MTLAQFLVSIVGSLVVRAVIALGFTAVTFTGATGIWSSLLSLAQSSWSGIPLATMQLATLSGIPQGIGTVFGVYAGLFALKAAVGGLKRFVLKT